MIIAVDAMGGERAPHAVVKGAVDACRHQCGHVALVGKEDDIAAELAKCHAKGLPISIVNASEVVGASDNPTQSLRRKPDSSIAVGMHLLTRGEASAFVSAGNSGAVMAAALLILGRIEGVERPALSHFYSTPWHSVLLLDMGANADCKPAFLVQFAQMGSGYMEKVFGVERPRVGLLSNGEEENKGNHLVRETHKLLKQTSLNFIGNVEGNDLATGVADVFVTDGFTGNVMLKTGEGLGEIMVRSLKQASAKRLHFKVAALLVGSALRAVLSGLDYAEHGGAPLLGVNGNVVIAHGRSDARAIKNAIFIAKQAAERGALEAIKVGIQRKE